MTSPDADPFRVLTSAHIERLHNYGTRTLLEGDRYLFREGDDVTSLHVVLEGAVAMSAGSVDGRDVTILTRHGPGQFVGELPLLTGERAALAARVEHPWAALLTIPHDRFRQLMAEETEIADLLFGALVARRELLQRQTLPLGVHVIGHQRSARAIELLSYLRRQHYLHPWPSR